MCYCVSKGVDSWPCGAPRCVVMAERTLPRWVLRAWYYYQLLFKRVRI